MKNASESAGMCGETDVNGVAAELNRGNRVLLMVRHAERPKIASDDPTFGMTLPLTEAGKEMSYTFGTLPVFTIHALASSSVFSTIVAVP